MEESTQSALYLLQAFWPSDGITKPVRPISLQNIHSGQSGIIRSQRRPASPFGLDSSFLFGLEERIGGKPF